MRKIKHLLFDCDGVLVDTEFIAANKMVQVLKDFGIVISTDQYLREFSGTTFSSIFNHFFGESMSAHEKERIINLVEEQVAAETTIIGGVENLLGEIPLPKSVVSNSSVNTVRQSLKTTGITHHFSTDIFSSELVKHPKPAPDVYLYALDRLKLNKQDVLVIEDSISGAKAALSSGLLVLGFTGGKHILPGHAEKLLSMGVLKVNDNMVALGVSIKSLIAN